MKAGIDRDMGAKHAKWFVTSAKTTGWLRETELVPKTQGVVKAIKEIKFAMSLLPKGKVPPPFPPHVAADVEESRALFDLVKTQGRDGAAGIVQGEKALMHLAHQGETIDGRSAGRATRTTTRARCVERRTSPTTSPRALGLGFGPVKKVAYYKGCLASLSAKELDTSTQALAPKVGYELVELESVTCCGAGDIHEAEPDYYLHLNARILAYAAAEGVDTLMTVCNVCTLNLRQANYQLLNDPALRERVNDNLEKVGAPRYETDVDCVHFLWLVAGESFDAAPGGRAQGSSRPQDRAVLRVPDPAAVEADGLRGPRQAGLPRADHHGMRR